MPDNVSSEVESVFVGSGLLHKTGPGPEGEPRMLVGRLIGKVCRVRSIGGGYLEEAVEKDC